MTADHPPDPVRVEVIDRVLVVTVDRPHARNAIDRVTAARLHDEFTAFDRDPGLDVAVLTGADGTFCAGADLHAIASGRGNVLTADMARPGPLGATRLDLGKPVIAAVEGHAVAGGLELALWCDLRVASESAVFGVYCRRWGVPLVDGGTVRLPRLIGHSRATDMILTGRGVGAAEALEFGLANRVVPVGHARAAALELARALSRFPQDCLRSDRRSAIDQWSLDHSEAMANETRLGIAVVASGETLAGATRFHSGQGRGGSFD